MLGALSNVKQIWGCDTQLEMDETQTEVSASLKGEVEFIIMEAAANACKHGGATELMLALRVDGSELLMHIRNNGTALRAANVESGAGVIEPRSIKNRVSKIGGQLTVRNQPGCVELVVRLPLL